MGFCQIIVRMLQGSIFFLKENFSVMRISHHSCLLCDFLACALTVGVKQKIPFLAGNVYKMKTKL